jgi:hypothetical protein
VRVEGLVQDLGFSLGYRHLRRRLHIGMFEALRGDHTHTHTLAHSHTHTHTHTHICMKVKGAEPSTEFAIHICIQMSSACVRVCECGCMHACMHVCMHICMHALMKPIVCCLYSIYVQIYTYAFNIRAGIHVCIQFTCRYTRILNIYSRQ